MLHAYLEILNDGYFEISEAFRDLADEHVWKRPADGLLSIGETAGHVAYWLSVRLTGDGKDAETDPAKRAVNGPLIDERFRYYPVTLNTSPTAEQLAMTAEQVIAELLRVRDESVAYFRTRDIDLDSQIPGYPSVFTYRAVVRYSAIHVAYHTGQIYSARHLLGETTPDN